MKKRRDIKHNDLKSPLEFLPEWFSVSPSMVSTLNSCEWEARFKYVLRIKSKQDNIAFLRGSIVHNMMQFALTKGKRPTPEEIEDFVTTRVTNEVSTIIEDYKLKKDTDAWEVIRQRYKIPSKKPTKADIEAGIDKPDAFNLEKFKKQCRSSIEILLDFVESRKLVPLVDPKTKQPLIELDIKHPMVTSTGEILDITHDKPTNIRSIIDFVAMDGVTGMMTIYDWKTALKKHSEGADISPIDTNQAVIAYVKALLHHMPRETWPNKMKDKEICVALVRAVVKNDGNKSMDDPEFFERLVTPEEIDEVVESYASAAQRLKSLDLRRQVTWKCDGCVYARLCLKKDLSDYYVYEYVEDQERE